MPRLARRAGGLALALAACTFAVPVYAVADRPVQTSTYADYSLMTVRSAGQAWSAGKPATQWAWSPGTGGFSDSAWGDPAAWPPASSERFQIDGAWVRMIGYIDTASNTLVPQVVTGESMGDVNCQHMTPLSVDGRQHYVQASVPSNAYCLLAVGYLDYQGARVHFTHQQVWFPPSGPTCNNAYFNGRTCIKQYEVWSDDNGNPGGPLTVKQRRDNILAKGLGAAFIITDYLHGNWRADLHSEWNWG